MGNADHSTYHRLLFERNEHWQSAAFEEKRVKALAAKAQTQAGHDYFAARGTKNILKYMQASPDHFRQAVAGNGERGKGFLVAHNQSERGRAKSTEIANRLYECEQCSEKVRSGLGLHNHRRWVHGYNHKVVAVVPLAECEDVYCLIVPEYHNFALEAGVFVHNCGMMAVQTSLQATDLPDNLYSMRSAIEQAIPHGRTDNGGRNDRGAWRDLPPRQVEVWQQLKPGYDRMVATHPRLDRGNHVKHLGTLGTGNHFIEVCLDEGDRVWFMLHSGSRGVGNRIGTHFIDLARQEMRRWMINLPDKDLAYFPEGTEHFDEYVEAVQWAQGYAMWNRTLLMERLIDAVASSEEVPAFDATLQVVNCHHNYVAQEHHYGQNILVTRKGAVRARVGDLGIIPGSMGAQSFIVRGLGQPESFQSCSHGAGRAMSRHEAKRRFTVADHIAATAGVECRKDVEVIDETPGAYKPIGDVMQAQRDLVEIVHTLRQVVCVKG
jgi:tRNA-splicing ligase RtcB